MELYMYQLINENLIFFGKKQLCIDISIIEGIQKTLLIDLKSLF